MKAELINRLKLMGEEAAIPRRWNRIGWLVSGVVRFALRQELRVSDIEI